MRGEFSTWCITLAHKNRSLFFFMAGSDDSRRCLLIANGRADPEDPQAQAQGDDHHRAGPGNWRDPVQNRLLGNRSPVYLIWGPERKEQLLAPGIARDHALGGCRLQGIYRGIYSALLLPDVRYHQGLYHPRKEPRRIHSLLRQWSDIHDCDCLQCGGVIGGDVPHPETNESITKGIALLSEGKVQAIERMIDGSFGGSGSL